MSWRYSHCWSGIYAAPDDWRSCGNFLAGGGSACHTLKAGEWTCCNFMPHVTWHASALLEDTYKTSC